MVQPKLVTTPDGLANELFGDVVMVTQFIHSYHSLICNDRNQKIKTGIYSILGSTWKTYFEVIYSYLLSLWIQVIQYNFLVFECSFKSFFSSFTIVFQIN